MTKGEGSNCWRPPEGWGPKFRALFLSSATHNFLSFFVEFWCEDRFEMCTFGVLGWPFWLKPCLSNGVLFHRLLLVLVSTTGMPRRGWRISEDLSRAVWHEILRGLRLRSKVATSRWTCSAQQFPGRSRFHSGSGRRNPVAGPRGSHLPNTVEVPRKVVVVPFMGKISAV